VRKNENGLLAFPFEGLLSGTAIDPIEKKPLYHYHPGATVFSVGFYGCNFRCPFCQNYAISQQVLDGSDRVPPRQLADLADQRGSFAIAYTYSEPLVHYEYLLEACTHARNSGLKNILVTNGYINAEPAATLLEVVDAANVDLKTFSETFYRNEIKGSRDPVLQFIRMAAASVHLEVTTLVIPDRTDSYSEIEKIAQFLGGINPDIPLHLSCYYPTYRYTIPATSPEQVFRLVEVAKRHLNYVYPGNVGRREVDTLCPHCSSLLVSRHGYLVRVLGLKDGMCTTCGTAIPIIGT
jgi:pyruvate formate lyase activating enzyme